MNVCHEELDQLLLAYMASGDSSVHRGESPATVGAGTRLSHLDPTPNPQAAEG